MKQDIEKEVPIMDLLTIKNIQLSTYEVELQLEEERSGWRFATKAELETYVRDSELSHDNDNIVALGSDMSWTYSVKSGRLHEGLRGWVWNRKFAFLIVHK